MQHRQLLMHTMNPERSKLVWEGANGPVLIEDMTKRHIQNALVFAERLCLDSPALPAMRERAKTLE